MNLSLNNVNVPSDLLNLTSLLFIWISLIGNSTNVPPSFKIHCDMTCLQSSTCHEYLPTSQTWTDITILSTMTQLFFRNNNSFKYLHECTVVESGLVKLYYEGKTSCHSHTTWSRVVSKSNSIHSGQLIVKHLHSKVLPMVVF